MTDSDIVRFHDFSLSPDPVTFRIDPDEFVCWPEVPLDSLVELATLNIGDGDRKAQMERVKDFFDGIMDEDSAARFRKRCAKPTKEAPNPRPIGMRHVTAILPWLMEVYGLRPIQPSSESEDGSESTDTSSTDSFSDEESTS